MYLSPFFRNPHQQSSPLRKETGVTFGVFVREDNGRETDGKRRLAHRDGNPIITFFFDENPNTFSLFVFLSLFKSDENKGKKISVKSHYHICCAT